MNNFGPLIFTTVRTVDQIPTVSTRVPMGKSRGKNSRKAYKRRQEALASAKVGDCVLAFNGKRWVQLEIVRKISAESGPNGGPTLWALVEKEAPEEGEYVLHNGELYCMIGTWGPKLAHGANLAQSRKKAVSACLGTPLGAPDYFSSGTTPGLDGRSPGAIV